MTILIPEVDLVVKKTERQAGGSDPAAGLPPQELTDLQSSENVAVLLSHEMLSCAAKLEGVAYLLGESTGSRDQASGQVLPILHSVARKLRYMGSSVFYLNFATAPLSPPVYQTVDLAALIDEVIVAYQVQSPDRRVVKACQVDLPGAWGDAEALCIVLDNLISNAFKYSASDSPIFITAEQHQGSTENDTGHLLVSVTNAGYIPADDQEKLFLKFYRGVHQQPGLGLGLPISRRLIERQGGQLEVESSITDGTTFWFTVPQAGI